MAALDGYLACAVWLGRLQEGGHQPQEEWTELDSVISAEQLSDSVKETASAFVAAFLTRAIAAGLLTEAEADEDQVGHDLFLSRNGHGTGFFDGEYDNADALQKMAKACGECGLYAWRDADGSVDMVWQSC